jgi:hypothetical protein
MRRPWCLIADDPAGYVMRHGWTAIDLGDMDEVEQLQKLFNSLEAEIIAVIEATDALKESPDYELYQITEQKPEVFERVVEQQIAGITEELIGLKTEAERLEKEIVELSGDDITKDNYFEYAVSPVTHQSTSQTTLAETAPAQPAPP